MNLPPEHRGDFAALPPVLRALLEAELAAGNEIIEVGHSFPAPPAGAYFKLARPVSTRPRATGDGITFCARNTSSYSGEFADERRFFFILEAPLPPPPEPDMDAIRAEREARQRAADQQRQAEIEDEIRRAKSRPIRLPKIGRTRVGRTHESSIVARFRASMEIDYERWKDGIGYDLSLLRQIAPADLKAIEDLLVVRGVHDWRDVEALAALDTPRARAVLRDTLAHGSKEHAVAVLQHAPQLADERDRTAILVAALADTEFFGGLSQTLREVEAHHPPEVIDALLRGVLERGDGVPVHFAAMLMFLHGRATTAFDWEQRPYFLKFNTTDPAGRAALFRDLCGRIGVDPARFLPR